MTSITTRRLVSVIGAALFAAGTPFAAASCPWDCDGSNDDIVGITDFLAVLGQWGQSETSCDFGAGAPCTQERTGSLEIELGGTASHGVAKVNNTANLDGTLTITLADGCTPSLGNTFDVVTYNARVGTFTTINGLDIGGGLVLEPAYLANALRLTVVSAR